MRRFLILAVLVASILPTSALSYGLPNQKTYDLSALKWRLVGPFRGGRSLAGCGSEKQPDTFWMGACGGGIWKTVDDGKHWTCMSDGFFTTSSVGAIAVAPSDPNIVYAGTGERDIRSDISEGDGVYKTIDGGKTWTHIGLEDTKTISAIVVDPTNPNVVYVAALGHVFGPDPHRGVYKSLDGGKTWMKVLYASDRAGAVDLVMDPKNSSILYAATWDGWRTPYSLNSGGPDSKLWKSVDSGQTWTDITSAKGMPEAPIGKIGITVSGADDSLLWASVEAKHGGIFRSDDAGASWKRVSNSHGMRQRAWYFSHIYAAPNNKKTVWVLNVGAYKSTNGGKSFSRTFFGHGDNHDLWIDPANVGHMIETNDGGATVTVDAGKTWSPETMPTAQFYHVAADNAFPYNLYGCQQDNSSVRIASRAQGPGIGSSDWSSTAGGESGWQAPKPNDPNVDFGGEYDGNIEMANRATHQNRDVDVWPDNPMGAGDVSSRERFQWTFPIIFSPNDPNELYTASQHVFVTHDDGQSWRRISPDLTRNDPAKEQSSGGPITQDNSSAEYYDTVFVLAESPVHKGEIWAGSDDGLVHVTTDGGDHWADVTPPQIPKWSLISSVEPSHLKDGVCYIAADDHQNDDYQPYLLKTSDFGKTWTSISGNLNSGDFCRVVREDPHDPNLLYAGTEKGAWVSFDQGGHWQTLGAGLPNTPVRDLMIKNDDLLAATHGRSFWILDDISPLRQINALDAEKVTLLKPDPALRVRWGGFFFRSRRGAPAPMGQNPLSGAVIDYFLPKKAKKAELTITDGKGNVVVTRTGVALPKSAGLHRIAAWLQYPSFSRFSGMHFWAGFPMPIQAPPGKYTVTLTADGQTSEQTLIWDKDPRSASSNRDLIHQFNFCRTVAARITVANDAVAQMRDLIDQIDALKKNAKAASVQPESDAFRTKLLAIEGTIYQYRIQSGEDALNYPIKLDDKLAGVFSAAAGGNFKPTDAEVATYKLLSAELQPHLDAYKALLATDLPAYDKLLTQAGLKPLKLKDPVKLRTVGRFFGGAAD